MEFLLEYVTKYTLSVISKKVDGIKNIGLATSVGIVFRGFQLKAHDGK